MLPRCHLASVLQVPSHQVGSKLCFKCFRRRRDTTNLTSQCVLGSSLSQGQSVSAGVHVWTKNKRVAGRTATSPLTAPPPTIVALAVTSGSDYNDSGSSNPSHSKRHAWLQRTQLLVGNHNLDRLQQTRVLLVGLGGVGSAAAEFLCRAGIGNMTLVDGDVFDLSNKNRQLPALNSTIGMSKAAVVAARLLDINSDLNLSASQRFIGTGEAEALLVPGSFDYLVDCIDSVAPKEELITAAVKAGIKVVSAMGAGGRLDTSAVRIADISETYNDAFAARLRKGLRHRGVHSGVTVVFSDEPVVASSLAHTRQQFKRSYYGTISYMPPLFGLHMAAHIVDEVCRGPMSRRSVAAAAAARRRQRRAYFRQEQSNLRKATGTEAAGGASAANGLVAADNTADSIGAFKESSKEAAYVHEATVATRVPGTGGNWGHYTAAESCPSPSISIPTAISNDASLSQGHSLAVGDG